MRVFVTGASGRIGSAVVGELIAAGHRVVALARSDAAAAARAVCGAEVQRGTLDDLDVLRAGAAASDGVIHTAYRHDLVFSGDLPGRGGRRSPRRRGPRRGLGGFRSTARHRLGDGRPHARRGADVARVFRLALETAPAGSVLHGVADEGVPTRAIAEAIGRHVQLAVASIPRERAHEHFGGLAGFVAADVPASSALTQARTGWRPAHPGLIDDLDHGHYFHDRAVAPARNRALRGDSRRRRPGA